MDIYDIDIYCDITMRCEDVNIHSWITNEEWLYVETPLAFGETRSGRHNRCLGSSLPAVAHVMRRHSPTSCC